MTTATLERLEEFQKFWDFHEGQLQSQFGSETLIRRARVGYFLGARVQASVMMVAPDNVDLSLPVASNKKAISVMIEAFNRKVEPKDITDESFVFDHLWEKLDNDTLNAERDYLAWLRAWAYTGAHDALVVIHETEVDKSDVATAIVDHSATVLEAMSAVQQDQ